MSTLWTWPNNARAAISLTYDDGNENNLDQAIPDLEAAGFRGTFYLHLARPDVQRRAADWRDAHLRGHEIGSHTVRHPCRAGPYLARGGQVPEWLGTPLERFTPAAIMLEVSAAAVWLDENIGHDPDRTFAYPCGAIAIGEPPDEASYDAAVLAHHFAARVCDPAVNYPGRVNLLRVAAFAGSGDDAQPFIGYCRRALAAGGWTVIAFHGIGGPSHTTSRPAHQALLRHLGDPTYWVAPFKEVGRYIQARRPNEVRP